MATERLDELMAALDAIPFEPRAGRLPAREVALLVKEGVDFVAHNLPRVNRVLVAANPYPRPWQRVRVPVDDDGTTLGGWFVDGRPGKPAFLYAPGTFQTKDDTTRKRRAIRFWREHGYSVLILDLRGFGESHASFGSGGYVEAHDLHRAADWLRARAGVERVVLMGGSLGGASSLIAASLPGAPERFAGVIAWSPFADLAEQMAYTNTNPGVGHPFYLPYVMYRTMVRVRTAGEVRDFGAFLERRAAELGLAPDELLRRSSPVHAVERVAVPSVVHHAEDDPIVPVAHAHRLMEAARANPLVRVRVLPAGAHVAFDRACEAWYYGTIRAFVDHVSGQ